jgi:hypothetical protein
MEYYWNYGTKAPFVTKSTSQELVISVLLEVWERGPFTNIEY